MSARVILRSALALTFALASAVGCARHPTRLTTLSAAEVRSCLASGGYESRTPFGQPFCQQSYPDGGRSCSAKSDCAGRCISEGDQAKAAALGAPSSGLCEKDHESFACFAVVDGGKIASPYTCYE